MGIDTVGNVGKDSSKKVDNTNTNPQKMGGSSPIETVGDVGMDEKGFSPDTMQHGPNKRSVPKGSGIESPGDIQ